jgi:hypothetical protein
MSRAGKVTVWVSIFSTLFMGCYSSELNDLNGKGRQETHSTEQRTYPSEIEYVVTKDGKQFHFVTPPTIVKDSIGNVLSSDIDYVNLKDGTKYTLDKLTGSGITPTETLKTNGTKVGYVITKDGTKYMFEGTTAVRNDTILGVLKATAAPGFADDPTAWSTVAKGTPVAIPLSDVAQVNVSELNGWLTALFVLGILTTVTAIAGLTSESPDYLSGLFRH